MKSVLYIVGTGPGDPELLTLKAINTLNRCPVIVSPKGSANGSSTALSIISSIIDFENKQIHELYFPMRKVRSSHPPDPEVSKAWLTAAEIVLKSLDEGNDVAFPTLGDPAIYSTGYYLYDTICELRPGIKVLFIPGIAAMSSCSASTATPICLGDEMVAVIPATFSNNRLKEVFMLFDTIILMKVHRVIERIARLVEECNLTDNTILVEQASTENEVIFKNINDLVVQPHYFSTMIIRKNKNN